MSILGKLIMSRYVAESITTDAGHFSHVGLINCVYTKLKILLCGTGYIYIANTDQWCYAIVLGFVIGLSM